MRLLYSFVAKKEVEGTLYCCSHVQLRAVFEEKGAVAAAVMERCIPMKRSLLATVRRPFSNPVHRSPLLGSSPSLSARSFARVLAMASSEDFGLQWQPAFRLEQAELMEDAPSLLKTCGDFDWKAQASELRTLAQLSLRNISPSPKSSPKDVGDRSKDNGDTWFAIGLALATAALVQVSFHFDALAAEESVQTTEAAEAASRAPAWLTPVLLAFPVVSYGVFYVYRSQVNPSAKVTDWMFGVAATVIIANLVLISTLGVRLY